DFDLAGYWRDHVTDFRARLYQDEALVRLSPSAGERIGHVMGAAVAAAAAAGTVEADGWLRARLPIETLGHAETEFLKLGGEVEVLAPAELRDRLASAAARMAALYG